MKRRNFLTTGTLALGGSALAAPAVAQSQPSIQWRCQSTYPQSIDVLYGCATVMADNVREATDGKFDIQVFAAGEIVPGLQSFDAASNNTVEMAHTASYYYTGKDAAFAYGSCLPFGMNTREQNAWVYHGEGGPLLDELYADYGLVAMPGGNTGCQMGGWFREEINGLDDIKGLKFRISGLGGRVMSEIGVVPQQIGGGDIYPSLERGTIDAAEFNAPYDDEKLGLYQVAPYYYYPGWWDQTAMLHFFINQSAYSALPSAYKAALRSAAAMANQDCLARYDALNPPALRSLVSKGTKMRAMPAEISQAAFEASQDLYSDLATESAAFAKLRESYDEFFRQSRTWNQVSEFAYNNTVLRLDRG